MNFQKSIKVWNDTNVPKIQMIKGKQKKITFKVKRTVQKAPKMKQS